MHNSLNSSLSLSCSLFCMDLTFTNRRAGFQTAAETRPARGRQNPACSHHRSAQQWQVHAHQQPHGMEGRVLVAHSFEPVGFLLDSFWTSMVLVGLSLDWQGSCWTQFGLVGFLLDLVWTEGRNLKTVWTVLDEVQVYP